MWKVHACMRINDLIRNLGWFLHQFTIELVSIAYRQRSDVHYLQLFNIRCINITYNYNLVKLIDKRMDGFKKTSKEVGSSRKNVEGKVNKPYLVGTMSSPPLTSSSQFFPSFQMRRWMKFNWTLSCWHHARQVVIIRHAVFFFPSSSSRQTSADWPFCAFGNLRFAPRPNFASRRSNRRKRW